MSDENTRQTRVGSDSRFGHVQGFRGGNTEIQARGRNGGDALSRPTSFEAKVRQTKGCRYRGSVCVALPVKDTERK
jgi:hypothetical protein